MVAWQLTQNMIKEGTNYMTEQKNEQANPEKVIGMLLQQISSLSLQLAITQSKLYDMQQQLQSAKGE